MQLIKDSSALIKIISFILIMSIVGMIYSHYAPYSNEIADSSSIMTFLNSAILKFNSILGGILFYKILGFPILVLWLVIGGLFFTIYLGFINIRLFGHAIKVVRGKYSKSSDPGEVTHFQALVSAISATVGLGNIAGVAIAVTIGGPGAVIWMFIAGFLGMSAKFAEVTLGQKYRTIDANGRVSGGAFNYLSRGLAEKGMPGLGKFLAILFAIFCIGGSLGGGNLFQSNQAATIVKSSFGLESMGSEIFIATFLTLMVGIVLIGGIKRIALVAEAVVPFMAFIYISAGLVVILANINQVDDALYIMVNDAFTGAAVGGGLIGALIAGFKRAAFSNEAGLGSAPIAHSAAKTSEPVREGIVSLLEPFIDTMVICLFTGLIITITGVYKTADSGTTGVLLTSQAFSTVIYWFPNILSIAVLLFAYSTMITWSYYGERSWSYLFGPNTIFIYHVIFCAFVFFGAILNNISAIVDFSDLLILSMAIPNLIGVYLLSGTVKKELKIYIQKLKNGEFDKN